MTDIAELPIVVAIGFSSRALVDACRIAGLKCLAIDHFGDADTRAHASEGWLPLCVTERGELTSECEHAIGKWACSHQQNSAAIAILAGGMENLPAVVHQLRRWMTVAGPDPEQMLALRDPLRWRQAASEAGLAFPELFQSYHEWLEHSDPKQADQWICKPIRSAGGLHIRTLGDVTSEMSAQNPPDIYLQRLVPGRPLGVTCLLEEDRSRVLGATESLTKDHWPAPTSFIYRGSIGPVPLPATSIDAIKRLADWYRNRWKVRGWLQFDFIDDGCGQLWLLECNPRWTAGMEILVHAHEPKLVLQHLSASGHLAATVCRNNSSAGTYAKAIVYAPRSGWFEPQTCLEMPGETGWTPIADIPFGRQWIETGYPIATIRSGVSGNITGIDTPPGLGLVSQLKHLARLFVLDK